jgi:hypothetical protein
MDKQFDELSNSRVKRITSRDVLQKLGIGFMAVLVAVLAMTATVAARADGYLLVSSFATHSVLRYNETNGSFVDAFVPAKSGGLRQPLGVIFGPDHNIYVSSGLDADAGTGTGRRDVLRFNGSTGAFMDDFADQNQLESPRGLLFGPEGNLYVASGIDVGTPVVARFNGVTGAFIDDFVPLGSGGLYSPFSMVFGPNGKKDGKLDLYVACAFKNNVLRYDGTTGAFKGVFIPTLTSASDLGFPGGMTFGPDGNLYISVQSSPYFSTDNISPAGNVLRYAGPSSSNPGAFLGVFIAGGSGGLSTPFGLLFGPGGDLFVASCVLEVPNGKLLFQGVPGTNQVLRYNGKTGAFKSVFVTADSGGLNCPTFMTFTETNPTTLNYNP